VPSERIKYGGRKRETAKTDQMKLGEEFGGIMPLK
jgi:hypothetical protein